MFHVHQIEDKDSLGYFLIHQRERQGYSLPEVARKIMVSQDNLECLENGTYENLPGKVYCKNFLKRYVEFLGFSLDEVWEVYKDELEPAFPERLTDYQHQPRLPLSLHNFITWPKVVRASLLSITALLLFGYVGYVAYGSLKPPVLTITQPDNNTVVQQPVITVRGETDPGVQVTINQQAVIVEDGVFEQELDLHEGVNEIRILAEKKHGRETSMTRSVIFDHTTTELSKR